MIGLLITAIAASLGFTCMLALNTPTRFETVKEGGTN
jgi:hypothetical protein